MTDLDNALEAAAFDARNAVQRETIPTASKIVRRARRRTVKVVVVVLVVGLGGAATLGRAGSDDRLGAVAGVELITSEMILADGKVSEAEYRAGANAWVSCLAEAGIETRVDFDNPNGHASFAGQGPTSLLMEQYRQEQERCMNLHLSGSVSLGWASALGQIDLQELRDQTIATFECVELRTGVDFGEVTHDRFDYLTPEGRQAKDAAFEFQDHQPWGGCQNELGYLAEIQAETRALVDCVEAKAGTDFGELTYHEFGSLSEEGLQAVRRASTHQSDATWTACEEELGLE